MSSDTPPVHPSPEDRADMAAMDAHGKPVVLLHPRRASAPLPPRTSKMGGSPDLPAAMRWPRCPTCDVPMNFVIQLFPQDLPEFPFEQDAEQFVLFRCRSETCDDSRIEKPIYGQHLAKADLAPRRQPAPLDDAEDEDGFDERVIECAFAPQRTNDYPTGWDDRAAWWGSTFEGFHQRLSNSDDAARQRLYATFLDRVTAREGTKIGGFPTWQQGDRYPTCTCGRRKEFVFQIASYEPGITESPHGIEIGDAGNFYFFTCAACGPSSFEMGWDCG